LSCHVQADENWLGDANKHIVATFSYKHDWDVRSKVQLQGGFTSFKAWKIVSIMRHAFLNAGALPLLPLCI
jgi:hypothetical protein